MWQVKRDTIIHWVFGDHQYLVTYYTKLIKSCLNQNLKKKQK